MAVVRYKNTPTVLETRDGRFTAVDDAGRQVFRSGQTTDSTLVASTVAAYSTLVYHPIAMALAILGLLIFLAEYHNNHGPLEMAASYLAEIVRDAATHPAFLRVLAKFVLPLLHFLIPYKLFFGKLCLIWATYACKPSQRHLYMSVALSFFAAIRILSYLDILLLSNLFFLYALFRNPMFKSLAFVVFVVIFVLDCIGLHVTTLLDIGTSLLQVPASPTVAPPPRRSKGTTSTP